MVLDGVDVVTTAWWVSFFPGVVTLVAVLGITLLGDWRRDALGPHSSRWAGWAAARPVACHGSSV